MDDKQNNPWTSLTVYKETLAEFNKARPGISQDHFTRALLAAWEDMSGEIRMLIIESTKERNENVEEDC